MSRIFSSDAFTKAPLSQAERVAAQHAVDSMRPAAEATAQLIRAQAWHTRGVLRMVIDKTNTKPYSSRSARFVRYEVPTVDAPIPYHRVDNNDSIVTTALNVGYVLLGEDHPRERVWRRDTPAYTAGIELTTTPVGVVNAKTDHSSIDTSGTAKSTLIGRVNADFEPVNPDVYAADLSPENIVNTIQSSLMNRISAALAVGQIANQIAVQHEITPVHPDVLLGMQLHAFSQILDTVQ